ncbi:MAG: hypothetical protein J7J70_05370 [Deltaproteobacteria bacterium]|nr:hypothetical protein [Candidatus Tharpellaceae bacterium]
MKCDKCHQECTDDDLIEYGSQQLCEDCYMDSVSPLKACDPWAVHSAKQSTQTADVQLLPIQKKMLKAIETQKAVLPELLAELLDITPRELQRNFAILRHMELLRGFKGEDGKVYWTLFKS